MLDRLFHPPWRRPAAAAPAPAPPPRPPRLRPVATLHQPRDAGLAALEHEIAASSDLALAEQIVLLAQFPFGPPTPRFRLAAAELARRALQRGQIRPAGRLP